MKITAAYKQGRELREGDILYAFRSSTDEPRITGMWRIVEMWDGPKPEWFTATIHRIWVETSGSDDATNDITIHASQKYLVDVPAVHSTIEAEDPRVVTI